MKKLKPNLKYLHPINAVIISAMLAIVLLVMCSCNSRNTDNSHRPVKKIAYIDFHFDCMINCIWNGSNIVIQYSDGTDYTKYNTISDSLFTNYICINVPNSLAHNLIEDYKDWYAADDILYAMHLEYRWYIEEIIENNTIKFTLKERAKDDKEASNLYTSSD